MTDQAQQGCTRCRADKATHGTLCYSCWSDDIEDEIEATEGNEGREECEAEIDPDSISCGDCADLRDILRVSNETNDACEKDWHESVTIPKDLAKLVLADLSPQMVSKAVRELLRTIEEQL